MSAVFDKLNLTAQERRILVVVLTVIFIVLNALLVWPHYDDWSKVKRQLVAAHATLATYQKEAGRIREYQVRLDALGKQGSAVLPAEQATEFAMTVQNQAKQSGVAITRMAPAATSPTASTNQFFDEQTLAVDVTAANKELIDFLVALGKGNSMIRVRDMDLRPEPAQVRLLSKITLVASYQKKPKVATASAATKADSTKPTRTNLAATKPAGTNAVTTRPVVTRPTVAKPVVNGPAATKPATNTTAATNKKL